MKIFNTRTDLASLAIILLLLAACTKGNNISTTLGANATVIVDDPVYFEDSVIGEVASVMPGNAGMQLQIDLNEGAILLLSSDAVAVENTLKPGTPVEIYNGLAEPGTLPSSGELQGMNSMIQFGTWALGNAVGISGLSLEKYTQQFTDYINSDDYADQQQQLNDTIQQSAEQAKQTIAQITEEIDKSVDQLQEMEDQLAVAGEQIGSEIGTVVQEIEKSGAEIYQELEKLSQKLEQQADSASQDDNGAINILIAFLKGLNSSLEDSVAESDIPKTEGTEGTEQKDN